MTDKDPFLNRIDAIKTERAESGNFTQRDICLSRFESIWKPLIDHVQNLADRHLPADKRLRVVFEVDENIRVYLKFILEHDLNAGRWGELQSLQFYKSTAHGPILNLLTGRLKLRDVFSRNALNDYALAGLEFGEKDERLKHAALHPARMDQAKDLIEYWLARQMAFEFDRDRINPRSTLQITIKRTDSGPERQP